MALFTLFGKGTQLIGMLSVVAHKKKAFNTFFLQNDSEKKSKSILTYQFIAKKKIF